MNVSKEYKLGAAIGSTVPITDRIMVEPANADEAYKGNASRVYAWTLIFSKNTC